MRNDRRWEASIKVEIPDFSGTLKAEGFADWLNTVERVFEFKDVPENKKVKWVAIKLKGRASAWQGSRSVEEYTKEFYELVSLSEVFQRALEVEKQQTRSGNRTWASQNKFVGEKQTEHGAKSQEPNVGLSKRPSVLRGSGAGNTTGSSSQTFKCFKCGELCHRSSDYRKERGKQLMIKNEKFETYDYEDEVEYNVKPRYDEDEEYNEDNFVYGDVGQMLVIQKSLLLPKEEEKDEWL
ncbi:hypothetical protein Tco_0849165 [Tanacetum coccineum]